jgi:hypothetical protein
MTGSLCCLLVERDLPTSSDPDFAIHQRDMLLQREGVRAVKTKRHHTALTPVQQALGESSFVQMNSGSLEITRCVNKVKKKLASGASAVTLGLLRWYLCVPLHHYIERHMYSCRQMCILSWLDSKGLEVNRARFQGFPYRVSS